MKLFISPHNDDAVLFGTFTLLREKPLVLTVLDSYIQVARGADWCDVVTRRKEDRQAIGGVLGCPIFFAGGRDDAPNWELIQAGFEGMEKFLGEPLEIIYAPAIEANGHDHHNHIGALAMDIWGDKRVQPYLTYTRTGGKSIGRSVYFEPEWLDLKRKALDCYQSQIKHPACAPHFEGPMHEYYPYYPY